MAIRLDQRRPVTIEELRARRMMMEAARGRRTLRRTPPRFILPRGQELELRTLLLRRVSVLEELVEERLFPVIGRAVSQTNAARPERRDAPGDEAEEVAERIRRFLEEADEVGPQIQRIAASTNTHNRREVDRSFETTLGVGLPSVEPATGDIVAGFVQENRRRERRLTQEALELVRDIVQRGLRRGLSSAAIERQIRAELEVTKKRARLIARDQIAGLNGELTQVRHASMGVTEYVWRTVGDERVRAAHMARNGRTFSWDNPPPDGHPGQPINCRCIAEPVLDDLFAGL